MNAYWSVLVAGAYSTPDVPPLDEAENSACTNSARSVPACGPLGPDASATLDEAEPGASTNSGRSPSDPIGPEGAAPLSFDPSRQHQPRDRATLRQAILELRSRGLTCRDISAALRLPESVVRDLLQEEPK